MNVENKKSITGFILAAVAAATYGMNPLFAVPLYREGMNPDSVLLFRYLFALPIIAGMALSRRRSLTLPKGAIFPAAILGLLMGLSSLTLFMSYNYMNSGIASTLLFVYPILVAVIMTAVYKERLTVRLVVCIAVASAGIALLCHTGGEATLSVVGCVMVAISALTYAVYLVAVSRPKLASVATLPLTFWMLLIGVLLFVGRILCGTELTMPATLGQWGCVVGLALFPTAVSFICTTRAIQLIGSTPTAILGALEPVAAIFFGIIFLGQGLTSREMFALALIIGAVTAVIAGAKLTGILTRVRRMFPSLKNKSGKKRRR